MTYKFRHQLRYAITVLLLASFVVSCSTNDILSSPDTDSPEIDFSTPALSRGIVTSSDDMSAFDVWGWYSSTTGNGEQTQVFEAKKVTNTGSGWKYDIPERWQQGNTYRFYAVYPSKDEDPKYKSASYDESGNLAITSFDCSHAVDLMTASKEVVCYDNGYPGKVNMTFSHELARIVLVAQKHPNSDNILNYNPTVHTAKLFGMHKTGDLKINYTDDLTVQQKIWTIPSSENSDEQPTNSSSPLIYITDSKSIPAGSEETVIFDALIFPQSIDATYCINFTYSAYNTPAETENTSLVLQTLPIKSWEAGKQYKYSFTITPDNLIIFNVPEVETWKESTGGIITVA